jgi:putative membrane protein
VSLREVALGLVAGLAGGLLGAGVMSAGHALATRVAGQHFTAPDSNQPDSTVLVAERISALVRGRPLDEPEKPVAGHLVHYLFGGATGLVYGAIAPVFPIITVGAGALYGIAVYVGAHGTVVPALGLARSPLRSPWKKEALELLLHVAYGVTVGLVVRTSRSARRR